MKQGTVKVLIVDDSLFFRTMLQRQLMNEPGIKVVGSAANAREAEKMIKELPVDVITMDIEMPHMRGTDFLRKLMPVQPLPVVLVSSLNIGLFEALDAGAIDFVKKPDLSSEADFAAFCGELAAKIKVASTAKIQRKPQEHREHPLQKLQTAETRYHLIAIGASTGGTEATLEILRQLPEDIPGILIVQHMPVGFTKMYADRLDRILRLRVSEARDGDRVARGRVLIAAGDRHMMLRKDSAGYYVHCAAGEKVSGHCPSVDVLFDSVAKTAKGDAIGVILTGMGRDGAAGLLRMRAEGAYTIGQDKESSVVYGMPMEAKALGAVTKQAPCRDIAGLIIRQLRSG